MAAMRRREKVLIVFLILAVLLLVPTIYFSLDYFQWVINSRGYPGLYAQSNYYSLTPADADLVTSGYWTPVASDLEGDGQTRSAADVKSLATLVRSDTVWFRFELYNLVDINEPAVSLAFDADGDQQTGKDWYGTTPDFRYDEILSVGYTREGTSYKGYNFFGDKRGVNKLTYDLATDCYFLGVPAVYIGSHEGRKYVAAVGSKGLWNDDVDGVVTLTLH